MARDIKSLNYVAIKIAKAAKEAGEAALDEIDILSKIQAKLREDPDLPSDFSPTVQLIDSFNHFGSNGKHVCLVFELMGVNLLDIIKRFNYKGIPVRFVKLITKQLLSSLAFIHDKCGVIHTDIKPENILVCLKDYEMEHVLIEGDLPKEICFNDCELDDREILKKKKKTEKKKKLKQKRKQKKKLLQMGLSDEKAAIMLKNFENSMETITKKCVEIEKTEEIDRPEVKSEPFRQYSLSKGEEWSVDIEEYKKEMKKYTGFLENKLKKAKLTTAVKVKIADFGNSCWKSHKFSNLIQSRHYRSPEVILGLSYGEKTDIWSLACLVFEMVTGDYLFDPKKGDEYSVNDDHLASMIELIGKIPLSLVEQAKYGKKYFSEGKLKNISELSFAPMEHILVEKYGVSKEESRGVSSFLTKMLRFRENDRLSAAELLEDSWLNDKEIEDKGGKESNLEDKHVESEQSSCFEGDVEDNSSYGLGEEESSTDLEDLIELDNFNNSFAEYGEFIQMEGNEEVNQFKRIIDKIKNE